MEGQICKIKDCNKILKYNDGHICAMHRSRFNRHGNYEISPNWPNLKKGQVLIAPTGYARINVDGKRMLYHRHIMELNLGRKLNQNERIHHKNGDRIDNRIENLKLLENNAEHMKKYHNDMWKKRKKYGPLSEEIIEKIMLRKDTKFGEFSECFCGIKKLMARNLCQNHYLWLWRNKLHD